MEKENMTLVAKMKRERQESVKQIELWTAKIELATAKIGWIDGLLLDAKDNVKDGETPESTISDTNEDTGDLSIPKIVKRVLEEHPDIWIGSSMIADKAAEMGIWEHRTPSYKSVMSRSLKRMSEGDIVWLRCKSKTEGSTHMLYKWAGEEGNYL